MGRGRWRGDRFDLPLLVIYLTPCHLFRENLRTLSKLYSQLVLLYFVHTRILSGGCNLRIHAFSFFFSTVIFGQLFFFFENGKKQVSARLTRIDLAFRCSRGKFFSFRSIKNKTNVCRRIYTQTYIHTYTYHAFNLSNPL